MATDYYAILGVDRQASPEDVKRAYRKLARELHPDLNPDPTTQERFKSVTAAYEVLSDAEKRQMYDLGADPLSPNGFGDGFGFAGFGDIMDAFFGQQTRGPRSRVRRGQDALVRMSLTLEEAVFGTTHELVVDTAVACATCEGSGAAPGTMPETCSMCRGRGEVQSVQKSFLGQVMTSRPCPQCGGYGTTIANPCTECAGEGRVRTRRTLTVNVPAGVDSGARLRLSGEGEVGVGGGPGGDLFVELVVASHDVFTRDGDDLHGSLTLPMTAAALGTEVVVETLDGPETIRVAPGTQPGHVFTIRGRGATRLRGGSRGDLHIHADVHVPTALDARQHELLTELAGIRDEGLPTLSTKSDAHPTGLFSRLRDAFAGR